MANSAFNLSSAIGADGRSIRAIKTQAGHGFSAGTVVRYELDADGADGAFKLARADSVVNAEAVGVVESVNGNQFTVVYQGEINTANFISNPGEIIGLTGSDVWFLDAGCSGGLTAAAPLSAGSVVKPVITLVSGSDDDRGLVTNYVGTVVGGENTVSLDSIHPVGEICPWGGETYNVPDGWQLCDGSTVGTATYPEYYTRVGTKYGYNISCDISFVSTAGSTSGMTGGGTAADTSIGVEGSILSYTHLTTTTGTLLVDPDYLVGGFQAGGETHTEISPHGLIFDAGAMTVTHQPDGGDLGTTACTATAVTVIAAKTPDLRGRHLIGANPGGGAFGGFDGYTAGQIGGMEDATTQHMADSGGGYHVYVGAGASNATLRSPYMAAHHIIRVSNMGKSALIGDVSVNNDGITDHNTPVPTNGDILVYGTSGGVDNYRNVQLFNEYPSTTSELDNFEGSFQIKTSSAGDAGAGAISIGHVSPEQDIHIKHAYSPAIRLQDTSGADCVLDIYAHQETAEIRTTNDDGLVLGTNDTAVITINKEASPYNQRVDIKEDLDVAGDLGVTGSIESTGNIKVGGQAYSFAKFQTGQNNTLNCDNSNSLIWQSGSSGNFNIVDVINHKAGGAYTFILRNVAGGNKNITFADSTDSTGIDMYFANNIVPSTVLAGQQVVISMVSDGTHLYCTFADFNAPAATVSTTEPPV
jgi:hypothetical protein